MEPLSAITPDWSSRFRMSFYALLLACFSLYIQVDWSPELGDEGFLWYGALKTFQGQIPLRDFQSYFPGRYYFTAAFFNFLGPNLLAVRLGGWVFQALAVVLAFRIARRVTNSTANTLLLGVFIILWMILPCRYFDSALVVAAVFFAVRFLEAPTSKRHFSLGVFTGIALFFGINHGWYAFVIFQALVVLNGIKTSSKNWIKNELAFLGGVFAGCLPLLFMALFVPGFGTALTDYIALTLSRNNDLPLPWPAFASWSLVSSMFPMFHQRILEFSLRNFLSLSFLLVPVFYLGSLIVVLKNPRSRWRSDSLLTACALVGTVYLHHVSRRMNIVYMGEAISPFLIGVWALASKPAVRPNKARPYFMIILLACMTFLGPGLLSNLWYRAFLPKGAMSQVRIGAYRFWALPSYKEEIDSVRRYAEENIPENETLFIAPLFPMYYCILNKTSPVHQLLFIFPEPKENQLKMIRDLDEKKVRWAIVGDAVFDKRPDLHFSNTHSLLWKYLNDKFDPYIVEGFPQGYFLWKRRL